jgi:hypothetical protein
MGYSMCFLTNKVTHVKPCQHFLPHHNKIIIILFLLNKKKTKKTKKNKQGVALSTLHPRESGGEPPLSPLEG